MIRRKKAEVTSQMFMYIAAAIIAAVILIIGVNAIMKLTKAQRDASDQLFKDSVTAYFDSVGSLSFGTERTKDFKILSEFKTICFLSRKLIASPGSEMTGYNEIDNAIRASSKNNVYLVSSKTTMAMEVSEMSSFSANLLSANPSLRHYCYNISNGKITIRIKSMGDSIEVVDVR